MRGTANRKYDKPSKLQSSDAPTNYPRQTGEQEALIHGSKMLAAAIWRTGKVYRKMTPHEIDDFETYAAGAVKVNIKRKEK